MTYFKTAIFFLIFIFPPYLMAKTHLHNDRSHNHLFPKEGIEHRHSGDAIGTFTLGHTDASSNSHSSSKVVNLSNLKGAKFLGGMIWQDQPINSEYKKIDFFQSEKYCQSLNLLGVNKWSLPSVNDFRNVYSVRSELHYIANDPDYKTSYFTKDVNCTHLTVFGIRHTREECVNIVSLNKAKHQSFSSRFSKTKKEYKQSVRCVLNPNIYAERRKNPQYQTQEFKSNLDPELQELVDGADNANLLNSQLQTFLKKHNIIHLVKYKHDGNIYLVKWHPSDEVVVGLNGSGYIQFPFYSGERTPKRIIRIRGEFNNGNLIGEGILEVERFIVGWVKADEYIKKIPVTSSSNFKSLITKGFKGVNAQAQRELDRRARKRREASSSYSSSSSSSSSVPYVMIDFSSVCGFALCSDKNLSISGGPGDFSPSFSGSDSGAIHKGYNGLAGTYNWSAEFDDYGCSGSFRLSGTKRNLTISSHKNCSTTYNEY